jgi:hypothetical protein
VELALAAGQPDACDSGDDEASRLHTRGQRLLRILVEDTALLYADLHPLDADYARAQRSWLAGQAADMTGGVVEVRTEGMLLRLPDDRPTSSAVTPMFPAATAGRWFALKVLDAAAEGAPDESGRITLTGPRVDAVVARAYTENFGALTKALGESPARLRSGVEPILTGLGLIRTDGDGWIVLPVAGRYRDPKAVWELTLEDIP